MNKQPTNQPPEDREEWKSKFEHWLIHNLQLTSKSNVQLIIDHVERYIRTSAPPPQPLGIDAEIKSYETMWREQMDANLKLNAELNQLSEHNRAIIKDLKETREQLFASQSSTSEEESIEDDWHKLIADIRLYENNSEEYEDFIEQLKSTYTISKR